MKLDRQAQRPELEWTMKQNILFLCAVLLMERRVESSKDLMKVITIKFMKELDACKAEMALSDTINADLSNLWEEGYELSNPMTGCAIICLSTKLNLVAPDGSLHHENIQDFAKKVGADETMAKQLVDLLEQCETIVPDNDDACLKTLGVVKCFKAGIHVLNWAPNMELVVGEMVPEV